jgi:hypothetical protein
VSSLYGEDDLPRLAVANMEVDPTVDPFVRALLLFDRTSADKS